MAPAVTLQPLDASVTTPNTATFTATASGTPLPRVQWQRSNDLGTTWVAIVGAVSTSDTTTASVTGNDGARFRAVFTNTAGSASLRRTRQTLPVPPWPIGASRV